MFGDWLKPSTSRTITNCNWFWTWHVLFGEVWQFVFMTVYVFSHSQNTVVVYLKRMYVDLGSGTRVDFQDWLRLALVSSCFWNWYSIFWAVQAFAKQLSSAGTIDSWWNMQIILGSDWFLAVQLHHLMSYVPWQDRHGLIMADRRSKDSPWKQRQGGQTSDMTPKLLQDIKPF